MTPELRTRLIAGLKDGSIVPCLGPGVLADVVSTATGAALPATSEQLILAMNGGKPMSPRLICGATDRKGVSLLMFSIERSSRCRGPCVGQP